MGNCFSEDGSDSPKAPGKNTGSTVGSKNSTARQGGKAGAKAKVEMSWAYLGRGMPPARTTFEPSRDPADYEVIGLRPGTVDGEEPGVVTAPGTGIKKNLPVVKEGPAKGLLPWIRLPGQINDQRINIENCHQCAFLLLDHCDSVQVDDCTDSLFYIGPTTGSVFIRNCKNCKFVVACGQLRTRDVKHSQFALFCQSRPVLENCSDIGIGPYIHTGYFELRGQFAKARLSVFNNRYSMVHDFTPKGNNYHYISFEDSAKLIPPLSCFGKEIAAHCSAEEEETFAEDPVVPCTNGIQAHSKPHVFIIVFRPGQIDEAQTFIEKIDRISRAQLFAPTSPKAKSSANSVLLLNTAEQVP